MRLVVSLLLAFGPLRPCIETKLFSPEMAGLQWDIDTRLDASRFALETWRAHPIVGVGLGNYQILTLIQAWAFAPWATRGGTPHETYLYLLGAMGIAGFVCVVVVMISSIAKSLSLRYDARLGLVSLALAFALATNMIAWFGDDASLL